MPDSHFVPLLGVLAIVGLVSVAITPRVRTADGFFRGWNEVGKAPGVVTLIFS